ncbi:MAG TPA: alpha,alpha-trehalase TreF [Panacibacter sp.]|nr:alpha,alpha-trehalase TreF [Panacibacter sp.]
MTTKEIYQLDELFEKVQMQSVLEDGKTFPDCIPKYALDVINEKYEVQKHNRGFDLKKFIGENFNLPQNDAGGYESDTSKPVELHIEQLWDVLTRKAQEPLTAALAEGNSLIPLPFPYIVPGGRFREIYYWDSYFTMLGLQVSKRIDMIENMVDNFSYLVDQIGYIPNGNRSYYRGRSQPPFYSLMVKLLSEEKGKDILVKYLPQLEKEYLFWMQGAGVPDETKNAMYRTVRMPDAVVLNRYWDEHDTPRAESYKEDVELAHTTENKAVLYRNIRAAAESGWDFSCRWFKDISAFSTIHTTDIVPVDLNCLVYHLEQTLSEAYGLLNNKDLAAGYKLLAAKRKAAIQKYCWNEEKGFYFDYDFKAQKQKDNYTLAAMFPLFFNLSSFHEAEKTAETLHRKFLKDGGLLTTPETTGQQWDAPNGWAPLQWIAIKGLENYYMFSLAKEIAERWIRLNKTVYKRTGKLMEKYNVADTSLDAGGGEYPSQDGFGWTNGVLLKLLSKQKHD